MSGIDVSKLSDCTNLTSAECLCSNKDALTELTDTAKSACKTAGIGTSNTHPTSHELLNLTLTPDLTNLSSTLCANTSNTAAAVPARHASKPMEPATGFGMMEHNSKRAYRPTSDDSTDDDDLPAADAADAAAPRVVYVTETRTECSCKSTPAPYDRMHISQISVNVPMSSSMGSVMATSTPYNSAMMPSSSVIFGSQVSVATPGPSGASANRFHTFQGAAHKTSAALGGIAALGVAAVMGLMIAL